MEQILLQKVIGIGLNYDFFFEMDNLQAFMPNKNMN